MAAAPRPTLRLLAAEAGVSVASMSLALRNSREIAPATRDRLQRLAAAKGYRPDPQMTKLMSHLRMRAPARSSANICGLFQDWAPRSKPKGDYFDRLCAGLRRRAAELGYAFELIDLGLYPRREQLQRVLISRGIEGVLVLPMRRPTDLIDRLDWRAFAAVSVTSTIAAPQLHRVIPHHFDNMLRTCRALKLAGCRRIGLALAKDWDVRVNHRWSAALAWQNQFGGTERVATFLEDRGELNLDPESFARWVERERPDAIIVNSAGHSAPSFEILFRRLPRARRPRIAAIDYPAPFADCGIDQRVEEIGATAIEVLAGLLNRGEKGLPDHPHSTLIDGVWHDGKIRRARKTSRSADR